MLFAGDAATSESKQSASATTMSNQDAQAKPASSLNAHTSSNLDAQATSNQGAKAKTQRLQDSAGNNITVQETCKILGFKWRHLPVFNERLTQTSTEVLAGVPSLLSQECRVGFVICGFCALCFCVFLSVSVCLTQHVFEHGCVRLAVCLSICVCTQNLTTHFSFVSACRTTPNSLCL